MFRRPGRPQKHRTLLARAFLAKMVLDIPTTTALVERLRSDQTLRHLCGWERGADVPSESTFSRAFAEFAESDLPGRLHAALIKEGYSEQLVGHPFLFTTASP
ncbi:MAG: transposase [Bacteroidota bacterium]|nr:transposase [Bacteroidota bacterium]